ncbi:MAG TPA: hypothetical protein VH560_00380 [Polyangia bacterium]|nr:hypothetical protein [Polyangia bacterium]
MLMMAVVAGVVACSCAAQVESDATADAGAVGPGVDCPGNPQCYSEGLGATCGEDIGTYCGYASNGEGLICHYDGNECGKNREGGHELGECRRHDGFFNGDCTGSAPVTGCDGVIYPNYCQMELKGHAVDNPFAGFPCPRLPDTCADTAQGTEAQCQAYGFCNNHAVVASRTLDNGFQQVVCGPDP